MTATERLRELLDERGVEYETEDRPTIRYTEWGDWLFSEPLDAKPHTLGAQCELMRIPATPEQAITATLGATYKQDPVWEEWHKSLRHERVETVGDAVEQLMYEAIEFGGDMGPNGNTYNGIDEGDVLTAGFINEWVERFESTLGRGTCHITDSGPYGYPYVCSECGASYDIDVRGGEFNYCPNCGARCVG